MNLDRRLLKVATGSRAALAVTIGLGFAGGVLVVLQARYLSEAIARSFLEHRGSQEVKGPLLLLLGIIVLRAGFAWASEISASAIARRVKTTLRGQLLEHLFALGPAYTNGERTGELANTALEGVEDLDAYFSRYLPQLALAALVPVTFLLFIFPVDPLSGAVLLVTAPLIPLFMILIGGAAQALTRRQWGTLSRLSAYFLDVLQGLTALKTLGRSKAQARVIAEASERFRQATMSVLRVTFLSALALELVSTLSTAVVAVEIGLRLLYGRLSFEQAFFVLVLAPEFYLPIRLLGARFHAGMSGVAAAKRIFEILETPLPEGKALPTLQRSASPGNERSRPSAIRFEDVCFAYSEGRPALKGVSFALEPGEITALVGPSGAGKSTVAGLLLGFLRPDQGRITVGDLNLSDLPLAGWRSRLAWVSQNPYLFDDTVSANIALARPGASFDEIVKAARLANAHEFIQELPDGYDTRIGERGTRLSGGQAQRIALARAFLKDAPILILDEAGANLDPEGEALLVQAFERLLENRTALIIAHRLSTVFRADKILVFEDGRLVEKGSHAELLKHGNLYRQLVATYRGEAGGLILPAFEGRAMDSPPGRSNGRFPVQRASPASALESLSSPALASSFWRLLKLAAPFAGLAVLAALLGFATVGSGIGLLAASAFILSAAALHPSIAVLQVAIVGVRFFGLSRGFFRYLERYLSHEVTFRLLANLRVWFYQALEPLAPARLLGYHSGDLLARILGDIQNLENFYVRALAPLGTAFLTGLAACAFMAYFAPLLALALVVFLAAAGIGVPALVRLLSRETARREVLTRAALKTALVAGLQGLADLLTNGAEVRQKKRIATLSRALALAQRRMAHLTGLQAGLEILLANLGMWAVLVLAIPLVQAGRFEGVYLAVIVLAALASFEAVAPLPAAFQALESSLESARRLFEIVDARPEVRDPENPQPAPRAYGLHVQDVSFRYPAPETFEGSTPLRTRMKGAPLVLDRIRFDLGERKRLAIVGPSGAGKSTLAHLLLRFWEYEQGEILLGGKDLRGYRGDDLRRAIGVVSQNAYLFNASVRENLLVACPKATEEQLVQAAQAARLHEFIQSLPQGYETWIGEHGLRLSGGERQRLAIARALLKDPPLLILDEATANLDALTEREVLGIIQELMQGRTTLWITHRLAGMEAMDEILVLCEGRIVERGRHSELLAAGGTYRRMWELQNGRLGETALV